MELKEDYIKLIFGLKLKQIRTERKLSLFGLGKKSGLSKSYLNEIEKGKKYPKTDKVIALAHALDVTYDELVSLKLDKNLAPVGELLQSNVLKEIPLTHFGIKQDDLIDIIANAPLKVNTFINTLIEIAKYYNLNKENFYLVALRSFQESNNNYFPSIEEQALEFKHQFLPHLKTQIQTIDLEEILVEEFGYKIEILETKNYTTLSELRSLFHPNTKKFYISNEIDDSQRLFLLAKEIGYNVLKLEQRPLTFSWIHYSSFEEVLNNFYASYFSGALLLNKKDFVNDLKNIFKKDKFETKYFKNLIAKYNVSSETLLQRMTNILPGILGLRNLFFLRFSSPINRLNIKLTKELHITNLHEPHAKKTNEHYCRKWVSSALLKNFDKSKSKYKMDVQISNYENKKSYFVLAAASKDPFQPQQVRSIGLGILINAKNKRVINFFNDNRLENKSVGVTCETCSISDCDLRASPPIILQKKQKFNQMSIELKQFLLDTK